MTTTFSAAQSFRPLELLARIDPRFWEILFPPQPPVLNPTLSAFERVRSAEMHSANNGEAGLNPQPLPPGDTLWRIVRDTSVSVAEATIAANLAGRDPGELLREVGDDWCPTPPRPPWPKKWPLPVQLQQALAVDGNNVRPAVQATAALVFQGYAARISDDALSTAFAGLADRLVTAALNNSEILTW
ncbi:hypothetical protein OG562_25140 [Streptomyces sp. NBC_01275]|uniref:hypothetical protein n=1 Tax=Streptomyces sp. NBC_01275 TaxID=2903807 RepID=UPI002256D458|nr:hypothetical protein [Streptomyces sp. NBC_01275]MCX4764184.1 hypothetical protein [Streptomyces sp. NBC_01275]